MAWGTSRRLRRPHIPTTAPTAPTTPLMRWSWLQGASGGRSLRYGPATHDPAQGRIMRQPVGVVHVFVSGQPPEHGLAKLRDQRVAAVLARPGVGESLSGQFRQPKCIIEVAEGEQTSVGRDPRAME